MKILATFANRTYAPEAIELVCAWDEFCVEGNYEGWEAERASALASWGSDLLRHATFEIEVPMAAIEAALNPEAQGQLSAQIVAEEPE